MAISNCNHCGKEFKYMPSQSTGKYCSNSCQAQQRAELALIKDIELFESGQLTRRPRIYEVLKHKEGNCCAECGITDWQGKSIRLQVDHINGDPYNNDPTNLRLLCPNCHSQTDSFAGANRGKGRKLALQK